MADLEPADWGAVGRAVYQRRIELGIERQQDLAERAGVHLNTVGRIERGVPSTRRNPTWPKIEAALEWSAGHINNLASGKTGAPEQRRARLRQGLGRPKRQGSLRCRRRGPVDPRAPDRGGLMPPNPQEVWTEERIRACGVRLDGVTAIQIVAGCGKTKAYELLRTPDALPFLRVLRIGRRFVVPTADVLAILGLDRGEPAP